MQSDVIEEMARAILPCFNKQLTARMEGSWVAANPAQRRMSQDAARAAARVLLKRLREPSEGMVDAGEALDEPGGYAPAAMDRASPEAHFSAMLDQFAKENGINE